MSSTGALLRLVLVLSALVQACAFAPLEPAAGEASETVTVMWRGDEVEVERGSEIRLRFRDDVEEAARERTVNEYGLPAGRRFSDGRFVYYVSILNPGRVEAVVDSLRLTGGVEIAEPNIPGTEIGSVL